MDAEPSRSANYDRLPFEARIVPLLHRREEGVHIQVGDNSHDPKTLHGDADREKGRTLSPDDTRPKRVLRMIVRTGRAIFPAEIYQKVCRHEPIILREYLH